MFSAARQRRDLLRLMEDETRSPIERARTLWELFGSFDEFYDDLCVALEDNNSPHFKAFSDFAGRVDSLLCDGEDSWGATIKDGVYSAEAVETMWNGDSRRYVVAVRLDGEDWVECIGGWAKTTDDGWRGRVLYESLDAASEAGRKFQDSRGNESPTGSV